MASDFSTVPFSDRARATADLALIAGRLPGKLFTALPALLAQVPDPDGAVNFLERYLRPDDQRPLPETLDYLARNPAALHYVLVIFSFSRFLSETLIQQPGVAIWLHKPVKARQFRRGIEHIKSQEDLEEDFARFAAGTTAPDDGAVLLARFKRREYLRITLRDVLGLATLTDTTLELSELADLLITRATHMAEAQLAPLFGTPQTTDVQGRRLPARLTVFALGKLGARELNYNSDVDLLFLYTGDGETTGGSSGKLTHGEYFIRLAHLLLNLISGVTSEGAVYRVDMRLRPRGAEGFLAMSLPAALDYYRASAREWELQMLIKARPVAGDLAAGHQFLRALHDHVFTPHFNIAAVEAVLNARAEMSRSLRRRAARLTPVAPADPHAAQWNVKLTPGGIRDIEFLVQCLQRLYGGADPWLSSPTAAPTLVALQRLHDKGHLSGRDFFRLASAYQLLRRVEHRLQLRDGLQRHTLPDPAASPPGALERLARRCAIESAAELERRITQSFSEVREIYENILVRHRPAVDQRAPCEGAPAAGDGGALLSRLRRESPPLATAVAEASGDALARRGLHRYFSAVVLDPPVFSELARHPQTVAVLAQLFSRSDWAVDALARHPEDAALLVPGTALAAPGPTEGFAPQSMSALRAWFRRESFRIAAQSLLHAPAVAATHAALSLRVSEALRHALTFACREILPPGLPAAAPELPFAVVALGRVGTCEMDIGSDVDLIFLADESLSADEREPWRRLAEHLLHLTGSHTREGLLFPVDTRLRPRGQEGEILQSVDYLCRYLQTEALGWEAVSWLKALPVAGNLALAGRALAQANAVLQRRWCPQDAAELRAQLIGLRGRLEREGTGPRSRTEFKHIAGGFFDLEYITGLLFFRAAPDARVGRQGPLPAAGRNILEQLAQLHAAGLLAAAPYEALCRAAVLFRSVDHAHRLITGRAANRTPDPALAERIARLLAQWSVPLVATGAEGLLATLAATRRETRSIYSTFF